MCALHHGCRPLNKAYLYRENKLVNYVHARPGKYLEATLNQLLLRPGETTNRILKRCLETPVEPTLASQNRTERFCAACLDPGYQEELKMCGKEHFAECGNSS